MCDLVHDVESIFHLCKLLTASRLFKMLLAVNIGHVKGYNVGGFTGQFFRIFESFFCFVVAIFDLVHDVEVIFHLLYF